MKHSRATVKILAALAVSGLVGVLVFWISEAFLVSQAKRGARSLLISHRAMLLYAMQPAPFASKPTEATAEQIHAPGPSPDYVVREQHRAYNEARRKLGSQPIYYKIAADNPRDPMNQADEREATLISFFNSHREQNQYNEIVERQGQKFLYYVAPFLENTQACLRCHGDRADAPIWLQERYPGARGFNEQSGRIRAVESILLPIETETRWAVVVGATLLASFLILGGLIFVNHWLARRVKERTQSLEHETAQRRKAEAQLLEAQKMEAIGTLAGGIAHDFNNILTAVLGFAEIACESIPADSKARDDLKQIMQASQRARDLVRQLLDFSRKSPREKTPLQVGAIAREALKLLRAGLPASIEVVDRIDVELWAIADPTGFHQIVMNLCTNAFQAMSDTGGVLLVELSRVEASFGDVPPALAPGPCTRLRVRDTGPGIPPEILGHIFEPYFTTRKSSGGTGLGLSVVQGLVTGFGGTVTVHSEVGHGTTFEVWLRSAQAPTPARPADGRGTSTGRERILVVDDEESVRTIGCRMLASQGYEVRATAGPEEAVDLLSADPHAFDLVLTDQTMPRMTGIRLAARLREISPSVKVVLMTGFSPAAEGHTASEVGIDAILAKPFTRHELTATVQAALGAKAGPPSRPA